ncbi:MAG: hypothetical protein ABR968_06000 [Bacteroidales bacterium]|jgi:hypothetical protein
MKTLQNNIIKLSEKLFGLIQIMMIPSENQGANLNKIFVRDSINEKKVLGEIFTNPLLVPVKRTE